MKPLFICFAAASLLALGGCADEYSDSGYYVSGGYAPETYDMAYDERHRAWWAEHERDRAFERHAALREHRRFCDRYPEDTSCEGWFHRP
jgi:hypothetical protein